MRRPLRPVTALLLAATLVGTPACRDRSQRQLAEEFVAHWVLAYNSHDIPSLTELYAAEGTFSVPPMRYWVTSRKRVGEEMDSIWRASPDLRVVRWQHLVVENGRIAFVGNLAGTWPDGWRRTFVAATFMFLQEGRIAGQLSVVREDTPPRSSGP